MRSNISVKCGSSVASALTMLGGVLLFLASCALYYWFSSAAGCAADLKGGIWGDPARALELESLSLVPALTAMTLAAAVPFICLRRALALRVSLAVLLFVFVGAVLFLGGINAEYIASHECSAEKR